MGEVYFLWFIYCFNQLDNNGENCSAKTTVHKDVFVKRKKNYKMLEFEKLSKLSLKSINLAEISRIWYKDELSSSIPLVLIKISPRGIFLFHRCYTTYDLKFFQVDINALEVSRCNLGKNLRMKFFPKQNLSLRENFAKFKILWNICMFNPLEVWCTF